MGKLSGKFREPNHKDRVTIFSFVSYARQLGLLVNTLGSHLKVRLRPLSTDSARELQRLRFEEGEITVPGREAGDNVETLGDTLARMVVQALCDIKSSKSQGKDTWYHTGQGRDWGSFGR